MIIKIRKISAYFVLFAILFVAAGFSDGMISSVKASSNDDSMMISDGGSTMIDQTMPMDNSLKPCCESKQGNASATSTSMFNQNIKMLSLGAVAAVSGSDSIFEHKVLELSESSPPRPDILSSVLKRE
ncbi:MAG: hypothetical protein WCI36_02475 [bacterium]